MRAAALKLVAVFLALLVTAGVVALSRIPLEAAEQEAALVRAAWRFRGTRMQVCRTLTAEELAAMPAHMRREQECEGRVLPYELSIAIDGSMVVQDTIRSAGARADRPLYVSRDIPVTPGTHRVTVQFERLEEVPDSGAVGGGAEVFRFDEVLTLDGRQVALITYDPEAESLVLRGYGR